MLGALKTAWQYCLPQHTLSRLCGYLANTKQPHIRRILINQFIRHYPINLSEASPSSLEDYACFNDFFTRRLHHDARPIDPTIGGLTSPADGCISEFGPIKDNQILQAKGRSFTVESLLGGQIDLAKTFYDGQFMTIYLAPHDYHRVHMPIEGQLKQMIYIPGRLFSVNPLTAQHVHHLFARNERVVCLFSTSIGDMALVLVGAMLVASIKTCWSGIVAPRREKVIQHWNYFDTMPVYPQGQDIAAFSFGSTVIALFPKNRIVFEPHLATNQLLKMGQLIGNSA